jgi:predicted acylesterase/phospholipase RssA
LICGTSAGAVVGATLCTHTDQELVELLTASQLSQLLTSFEEPRWVTIRRFLTSGTLYDAAQWKPKIEALCNQARHPDLTFQEAFELTGRELCVTVTARRRHEPPLVLSRLSAPDVTVASAVLATVAMPFLIPAQRLVCKASDGRLRPWVVPNLVVPSSTEAPNAAAPGSGSPGSGSAGAEWRDGSIVHDTPREQLAQHFGVSFTVASQCNPHVVPLFIALRPTAGKPAISRLQRGRSEWRGGFALSAVLVLLLSDAKKWLTLLRELQIMPLILDTDWSGLFLQDFMGDVTIIPPLGLKDYARMLSDPTPAIMQRYLDVGQRETWRKMPMLATRLRIAHALQALQAAFSDGTDDLTGARSTRAPSQAEALSPGYGVGTPMKRRDSKLCF